MTLDFTLCFLLGLLAGVCATTAFRVTVPPKRRRRKRDRLTYNPRTGEFEQC